MNDSSRIIENTKEIEKINDRFTLMLDRLEEKMDDLNKNMNKGFNELNGKITNLENKFDVLENRMNENDKNLPEEVEAIVSSKLEIKKKNRVYNYFHWFFISVLGSGAIYTFGRLIYEFVSKAIGI